MEYKSAQKLFNQFPVDWPLQNHYYIWGAGNTARKFCAHMSGLQIEGFLDSDPQKWGGMVSQTPILNPESVLGSKSVKIIVASVAYSEIRAVLESKGLEENIDFCDSRVFLGVYLWVQKRQVYITRTDVSITSHCNLRCKDCNMRIPYYGNPGHYEPDRILNDIDLYFQWVDFVEVFHLLGGEPFLHPHVLEITQTVAERYRSQMGDLVFFTNGTIIPQKSMLELMREYRIKAYIGDYRLALQSIQPRVNAFIETLEAYGVLYETSENSAWSDFNHTETDRSNWNSKQLSEVCRRCCPPFRGLHDQKFYFCHLSASAALSGHFSEEIGDYFDLSNPAGDRGGELVAFDLGCIPKKYVSYCRYCGGCAPANIQEVPVAEQLQIICKRN